jgi:hypothetical protein
MRKLLLILLAAMLFAPAPAGIPAGPTAEPCQCEPVACHCSGHDHGAAHGPMCAFANGGRCGVKSSDITATDSSSRSDMLLAEAHTVSGLITQHFELIVPAVTDKAGYETPPTPPPRSQA